MGTAVGTVRVNPKEEKDNLLLQLQGRQAVHRRRGRSSTANATTVERLVIRKPTVGLLLERAKAMGRATTATRRATMQLQFKIYLNQNLKLLQTAWNYAVWWSSIR